MATSRLVELQPGNQDNVSGPRPHLRETKAIGHEKSTRNLVSNIGKSKGKLEVSESNQVKKSPLDLHLESLKSLKEWVKINFPPGGKGQSKREAENRLPESKVDGSIASQKGKTITGVILPSEEAIIAKWAKYHETPVLRQSTIEQSRAPIDEWMRRLNPSRKKGENRSVGLANQALICVPDIPAHRGSDDHIDLTSSEPLAQQRKHCSHGDTIHRMRPSGLAQWYGTLNQSNDGIGEGHDCGRVYMFHRPNGMGTRPMYPKVHVGKGAKTTFLTDPIECGEQTNVEVLSNRIDQNIIFSGSPSGVAGHKIIFSR